MKCMDCKKNCPAKAEPQNVVMDMACEALREYCDKGITPDNPMDWIRGWIVGADNGKA